MLSLHARLAPLCVLTLAMIGLTERTVRGGPLSAERGLASLRVEDDLAVERFAAEPHVIDPAAMTFFQAGCIVVARHPSRQRIGQFGMTASISTIRRIVSRRATTTFW